MPGSFHLLLWLGVKRFPAYIARKEERKRGRKGGREGGRERRREVGRELSITECDGYLKAQLLCGLSCSHDVPSRRVSLGLPQSLQHTVLKVTLKFNIILKH